MQKQFIPALKLPNTALRLTPRPENFIEHVLNSAAVWLALMLYWAFADLLILIFPPGGRQVPPDGWLVHVIITFVGLAVIWCIHQTGFPAAWDVRFPAVRRLLLPMLIGALFGTLAIGIELITESIKRAEAQSGSPLTVDFPGSILVYSSGAIYLELLFLFLPVSVLLWLISNVMLQGRSQKQIFWVLAVFSSAIEPFWQGSAVIAQAEGAIEPLGIALYVVHSFAFNFSAAALFRRYGLLAAILVRLGNYMVWHVLYGNFLA